MHTLIIGRTETGKTTLAKIIAKQSQKAGRQTIVLDPISSDWEGAVIVDTVEELLHEAKTHPNRLLVVDESAVSLDKFDSEQLWLAKAARHNGHSSVFIGQDYVDVPKGIRSQCSQIFVFGCARDEAKELANKFDDKRLLDSSKQKVGEFYRILVNKGVQKGKLNFDTMEIMLEPEPKNA